MILFCFASERGLPEDLSAIEVLLYYYYEGVSPYSNVDNTGCLGIVSLIFLLVFLLASLN